MENNKQQMTVEVTKQVQELEAIKSKVIDQVELLEETSEQDAQAVTELQEQLEAIEQERAEATDVKEAKRLVKKAQEIKEEIELTQGVNEARAKKRAVELEDLAEELFSVHKKAVFLYRGLELEYQSTVSVRSLQEDSATLQDLANKINNAFKFTRYVLLDFEIVSVEEQNKSFKGFHLGQRELYTELKRIFNLEKVRQVELQSK